MPNPKPGIDTTEYKQAKSGSTWGIIATILGFLISAGSAVGEVLGTETMIGIIVGGVIAVAGILQKVLVDLGYIKSRTDVKTTASLSDPSIEP